MPALTLNDLQQRIAKQDAELQKLRQELEARQSQFATLNKRRQTLQAELQLVEKELAAVAEGKRVTSAGPKNAPKKKATKPSMAQKDTAPLSLPALIVSLIREAGRPLTVQQLVVQIKKRGFRSASMNFPKMLKIRVYELLKKGLVMRAADQSGFVLGKSGTKPAPKVKPSSKSK